MASEPTTMEKLRGMPWSIATFVSNTFFVQFTFFGSVFPLFLAELGLSKGQVSKRASGLIDKGRLVKSGRWYALP